MFDRNNAETEGVSLSENNARKVPESLRMIQRCSDPSKVSYIKPYDKSEKQLAGKKIYGVGYVYGRHLIGLDDSIDKSFSKHQIKKLTKYKMLGYENVYLTEDGFGIIVEGKANNLNLQDIDYFVGISGQLKTDEALEFKGISLENFLLRADKIKVTDCLDLLTIHGGTFIVDGASDITVRDCIETSIYGQVKDGCNLDIYHGQFVAINLENSKLNVIELYNCNDINMGFDDTYCELSIKTSDVIIRVEKPNDFKKIKIRLSSGLGQIELVNSHRVHIENSLFTSKHNVDLRHDIDTLYNILTKRLRYKLT